MLKWISGDNEKGHGKRLEVPWLGKEWLDAVREGYEKVAHRLNPDSQRLNPTVDTAVVEENQLRHKAKSYHSKPYSDRKERDV